MTENPINSALIALGEILESQGTEVSIVIVGGTALNMLGIVNRTTRDVDVLGICEGTPNQVGASLRPPDPLPEGLSVSIKRIARDFGLPTDWMNTKVGLQWRSGLPPGLEERIT